MVVDHQIMVENRINKPKMVVDHRIMVEVVDHRIMVEVVDHRITRITIFGMKIPGFSTLMKF